MNDAILKYDSVEISYGGKPVLKDVSISVQKGEILGVIGESGSGKSTLIKAAAGLLGKDGAVTRGGVNFRGRLLSNLNKKELRKIRGSKIGMVFQDAGASFCPVRKIGDQICESVSAHVKTSKKDVKTQAIKLFETLELKDSPRVWDSYPFELSGGMNQRVAIASAMLMNPDILLADEPTSALDTASRKQVANELLRLRELFGTSVVLVTHDIGLASHMADTILVLKNGNVKEYGEAEKVLENPGSAYTKSLLSMRPKLGRN